MPILGSHQHTYSVIPRNDRVMEQATCAVEKSMLVNRGKLYLSLPRNSIHDFRIIIQTKAGNNDSFYWVGIEQHICFYRSMVIRWKTGNNHRLTYVTMGWKQDTSPYSYEFLLIATSTRLEGNYVRLDLQNSCLIISFFFTIFHI